MTMSITLTRLPKLHKVSIAFISVIITITLFSLPDFDDLTRNQPKLEVGKIYPLEMTNEFLQSKAPSKNWLQWQLHTIQSGESASVLFSRIGLPAKLLHQLITSDTDIKTQLSRLRPGDILNFGFNQNDQLIELIRPLSAYQSFHIYKQGDVFTSKIESKNIDIQYNYTQAIITSNFWNAASNSGLTPNQIMSLAGIFGWDIDFALDLRAGDHFEVLYEDRFIEGRNIGQGNIISAVFTSQGSTFKAILNPKDGNYYDEDGRAMKKAFLRSPIDFRRVTSNFNPTRRHPVTGKIVAHRGTDYAAPVGTPIWAAGDGVVEKSGYNQFNGNYVFIRHSNTYITKYLHMKKRSVNTGQRVKQGDTVGTLGGTGRVTGPHLHYEFLVNGIHKNPRTVNLPQSKSLTGQDKSNFIALAQQNLAQLKRYNHLLIAKE